MGVDAGDFDNDGDEDLFMTELTGRRDTICTSTTGQGLFDEPERAIGPRRRQPRRITGFGTAWFDFDNDGWLDLLAVNGAVDDQEAPSTRSDPFPLHQRKLLFRNLGNGRFEEVTSAGRRGIRALGSRPRRGVRRHRQRRRHRRRRSPTTPDRSGC